MKFAFRTYGCKMNQLDSARISAALSAAGHSLTSQEAQADYVFVNSCTVTAQADRKSRQGARAAARLAGPRQVAVLGCSVRSDSDAWQAQLPEALVFAEESELLAHFGATGDVTRLPLTDRARLPVAIQTGCDDTCTFCITTIARGAHRSLPLAQIVETVARAADAGVREVVLTGINLAAWGSPQTKRAPGEARLHELLQALLEQTAMPRIRLSSLGPQYLAPAFFDVFADPRVCDHLHLSVQSGSPGVLRRMDRGHDADVVVEVARRGRAARRDVAITADFIAGFPGETDTEFAETLALVEQVAFAKLHVFPFSARSGTRGAEMPGQLPGDLRKERAASLRALGDRLRRDFIAGQLGKRQQVLIERQGQGHTGNYIGVRLPQAREGELVECILAPEHLSDRFL